jgi:lipopolysaccharide heptosyltransferase II
MSPASSQSPVAPESIRKVLVIRPRFVGDICLTTPVLTHLQRILPWAEVHYLAEEEAAPLLEGDPRLARLWTVPRKASALATARLCGALRAEKFDLVMDLFCNPRTALWTAATGARWRVGYPNKKLRSAAYNVLVRPTEKSAVRFHLASLEALGWDAPYVPPRIYVRDEERFAARAALGVPVDVELIGMHPGARWPTRRWAPEDIAALGRTLLAERPRDRLLVFAGPGEEELAEGIVADVGDPRALLVAGLSLRAFAATVSLCRAFVAGDSGPVHVAASVGAPTIGIFGRNEPERFFPYREEDGNRSVYARVWCSPCHRDECDHLSCLRAISPEWVYDVVRRTLA